MLEKRVLHLINSASLGGAESIVRGILQERPDSCFCLQRTAIHRFDNLGDRVQFGTNGTWYKYNPLILYKLFCFIKKTKPEILHVHLGISFMYAWAIKKFVPKISLVYHEHGEIQMNANLRSFIRFAKSSVSLFVAVSQSIKRRLKNDCGVDESEIEVLPSYIDTQKFNPECVKGDFMAFRETYGIAQKAFLVGFAGRLIEIKGWREFLEAAKLTASIEPNVTFVIAGDGIEKEAMLKQIVDTGLAKRTIYLGYVTNMPEFYSRLDCLCVPSHFEASPVSVIEALAMGVPLIVSRIDGVTEIIEDGKNGILFEKGDAEDLSEKVLHLIRQSEVRQALRGQAAASARTYSLKAYIQKLSEIYSRVR